MKRDFEKWLKKVDDILWKRYNLAHHDDLPDWGWRDAFEEGYTPSAAVKEAMAEMVGGAFF